MPFTQQEPVYQSDASWLVIDLINHQPILIDIRDAANSNDTVAICNTGIDEIFLKHGDAFSSFQVLLKVHILLGGQQGDYNLAQSGEKTRPTVDRQQLQLVRKALNNLRHSDDYDSEDYAYTSDSLAKTAKEYLQQPLIKNGTGQDNDYESKIKAQIAHYTKTDELTDIENLYFNAIKLIKLLREPGIIRHVMTRRKYKLKSVKLNYSAVTLPESEGIYVKYHQDYKYAVTSDSTSHRFIGRFNQQGLADIKIPQKLKGISDWQLVAVAVDDDLVNQYTLKSFYNAYSDAEMGALFGPGGADVENSLGFRYGAKYKNQIKGGLQIAEGLITIAIAGAIEIGTGGLGTSFALAIGFIGSDKIATGISRIVMDREETTLTENIIAWSGIPKKYVGLTYAAVDLSLAGGALALPKNLSMAANKITLTTVTRANPSKNIIKDVQVNIENISKNTAQNRHLIELKNTDTLVLNEFKIESFVEKLTSRPPANPEFHSSSPVTKPILTEVESTEKIVKNSDGLNEITITKTPLEGQKRLNTPDLGGNSKLKPAEAASAAQLETALGKMERYTPPKGAITDKTPDFVITSGPNKGKTVDAMYTTDKLSQKEIDGINKFYEKNMNSGGGKKVIQDHLKKADYVPIDFKVLTPANQKIFMNYIKTLPKSQQDKIIIMR